MPIVYIPATADMIPAIIVDDDPAILLQKVLALKTVPDDIITKEELLIWLENGAEPAGWYETRAQFRARVEAIAQFKDVTPDEIKAAREILAPEGQKQLSQASFMRSISPEDSTANDTTLKSNYQNIITGRRKLSAQKALKMRSLVARAQLHNKIDKLGKR